MVQRLGGWWHWIIISHPLSTATHLRQLKQSWDLPHKPPNIHLARDLGELLPPCWGFELLHTPLDPLGTIIEGGLRWQGQLGVISLFCFGQEPLQVRVKGRHALQVLLCSRPCGWFAQSPLTPSWWMRLTDTCVPLQATFWRWFFKSNLLS